MKLKFVVVDLGLSAREKRVLAALIVPILVLGAGAVAYANVQHTWKEGEVLNSADLNGTFDDLDKRIAKVEQAQAATGPAAWTVSGKDVYASVDGNVGVGTPTPAAKLDVQGTLNVDQDMTLLPQKNCRSITLDDSGGGDLGAQMSVLIAKYRCMTLTLKANTSWTWNTPVRVNEHQFVYLVGEGYTNMATNITVNVNMTQNHTDLANGTSCRNPMRVEVGDGGTFGIAGVHVLETSNDGRPLTPDDRGGALFDTAGSFATIEVEQILIDSSEDIVGVGSRGVANVRFGHTFISKGSSSPRDILASKVYTGWGWAGGYGIVHNSFTTLGPG